MMTIVLPTHPLTEGEVASLTTSLTQREIRRAEGDIDYARIMSDPKLRTDARVLANCVGSLNALGYSHRWLANVLGVPVDALSPPRDSPVPADLMRDALTAAIRIGSRWATPESTGQSKEEIEQAKRQARDEHRHTPAAYDPIYVYVKHSAPLHAQVAQRPPDVRDALRIRAVTHLVEHGGTAASVAAAVGLSDRTVERARRLIGLEVARHDNVVTVAPGQGKLVRAVLRTSLELGMGIKHPTLVWTDLIAEAADIHAAAVAGGYARAA